MRTLGVDVRSMAWLVMLGAIMSGCDPSSPTRTEEEWTVWAVRLPPPTLDPSPPVGSGLQTAVLAGGCFWGVEALFEHVKGVEAVTSGYSGGTLATATYAAVTGGMTGHAESVHIRFDPAKISFGKILQVFFSVAHDPTQVDAQLPDLGAQYRSHIYYADQTQHDIARAYILQLTNSGLVPNRIATRLDSLAAFYPAEGEHQDYAARNPLEHDIVRFYLPRLDGLRSLFPDLYQATPPLVLGPPSISW